MSRIVIGKHCSRWLCEICSDIGYRPLLWRDGLDWSSRIGYSMEMPADRWGTLTFHQSLSVQLSENMTTLPEIVCQRGAESLNLG